MCKLSLPSVSYPCPYRFAVVLFLCRVSARPSCLRTSGSHENDEQKAIKVDVGYCPKEEIECIGGKESTCSASLSLNGSLHSEITRREAESSTTMDTDSIHGDEDGDDMVRSESNSFVSEKVSFCENESEAIRNNRINSTAVIENQGITDRNGTQPCSSDMEEVPSCQWRSHIQDIGGNCPP